jgi:hypothetical protein
MLKHRGLKTFLTYSFLVIMMKINEATFPCLEILATGMISEQLAPLISQCPISRNSDVELKNRKPREPDERDVREMNGSMGDAALKTFFKIKCQGRMIFKVASAISICVSYRILVLILRF